jgi:hypothetical protein
MSTHSNDKRLLLYGTFLFAIISSLLSSIYAAIVLRGLFADGAYYLLHMMASGSFALWEPARTVAHGFQQFATVLLLKTGVSDLDSIAQFFGLNLLLLPLILVVSSFFFLPTDCRHLFLLPLCFYLAGALSSSFLAVGASVVAASYFWPLFFLILFMRGSHLSRLLTLPASIATVLMHEVYLFLGPVLMAATVHRFRAASRRIDRLFFLTLTLIFLCTTVVALYFVVFPRSVLNRAAFIDDMVHFAFLFRGTDINVPAVFGIFVFAGIVAGLAIRKSDSRLKSVVLIATGVGTIIAALSPMVSDGMLSPWLQFSARDFGALCVPLLVLIGLTSRSSPRVRDHLRSRFTLVMIVLLAVGQVGWHVTASLQWHRYVSVFRDTLDENCGLVGFEEAVQGYPKQVQDDVWKMTCQWTNPTMSLLLSRDGEVKTIVANPEHGGWEPFDPRLPGWYANDRYFDLTTYRSCAD